MDNDLESKVLIALREIKKSTFSTYDFILYFETLFSKEWQELVNKYGQGGAGAGKNYSANSRISQILNKLANNGEVFKLHYRKSHKGWGSPVIRYWSVTNSDDLYLLEQYPDEIDPKSQIIEGARKEVWVNRYERSQEARKQCIQEWGVSCSVCDFNFEEKYGELGEGYIHVHHLIPLSEIGGAYEVNPINDLRPVCPNCHAMLHRVKPPLSIQELRDLLNGI